MRVGQVYPPFSDSSFVRSDNSVFKRLTLDVTSSCSRWLSPAVFYRYCREQLAERLPRPSLIVRRCLMRVGEHPRIRTSVLVGVKLQWLPMHWYRQRGIGVDVATAARLKLHPLPGADIVCNYLEDMYSRWA